MPRTDLLKGLGVFGLVVVVVLAGTVATGTLLTGSSTTSNAVNVSAYDSDALLPTAVDDDGTVDAPDEADAKTIVIDKSHGNAVSEGEIQPLVDALVRDGHDVRFYTGGQSQSFGGAGGSSNLNSTLESADAFVVVNPSSTYSESEIDGVESFADAGGRVLMLADPVSASQSQSVSIPLIGSSGGNTVTPGQPTNLAARFGISFGSGYLYNMEENANNFQSVFARPVGNDSLASGVDRVVVRDATPLTTSTNVTRVVESDGARLSSTRRADAYAVAARVGNVATVGDTDFLAPATATVADNDAFVSNLAQFLVTGDKESNAPATDSAASGPGGITTPSMPGNVSGP
ncbi:GldG family protein [Halorientalis brevis]|uniref:GldG family protein n=1 Tax=Halorientalis brevis TaxID=1126241 RepID=A0ABD6C580_9EURY|nr:GldG family protein [Halorientalis brevis]